MEYDGIYPRFADFEKYSLYVFIIFPFFCKYLFKGIFAHRSTLISVVISFKRFCR